MNTEIKTNNDELLEEDLSFLEVEVMDMAVTAHEPGRH